MGSTTVKIFQVVPKRLHREILEAAANEGLNASQWIRRAIQRSLRHTDSWRFREVVLTPRSSSSVDDLFVWLCARRPHLADFQPAGGEWAPDVRRAMRKVLTPLQLHRVEQVLIHGRTLEDVGRTSGCSKQAVSASVFRAAERLATDEGFVSALCRQFPESGLTPGLLMRAMKEKRP